MSAIYGVLYQGEQHRRWAIGAAMGESFRRYPADDSSIWFNNEIYFGCRAQHVTPESVREKLPFYDQQDDLAITADAIIDNRQALYERLAIPYERRKSMTDGELILAAYLKWGNTCPQYLLGDFAFAIWDGRRRELFCATDAMGTRTLYYCQTAGSFAFATLMEPLFFVPGMERRFNDIWIADFLALPSVIHQLDPELTLYEGIHLLPAGHTLTVGRWGFTKAVYWQVKPQPELKLASDAEYEEAFRDIFGEAVRCRMRSRNPVAVMMSGGLDSTSVAAIAARELAQRGRRLQVFSAVPMEGFLRSPASAELVDETPFIEAVKTHIENMDVTYCRAEGRHPLSATDRLFSMLEQPYKMSENIFWFDDIIAAAKERNTGVLLSGQSGNETISWGDLNSYAATLVKKGKWTLLLRETRAYAERWQRSGFKVLAYLLLQSMPYVVQKTALFFRDRDAYNAMDISPVNPDFARQCRIQDRFRRFDFDPLFIRGGERWRMLAKDFTSHMASMLTRISLTYGMAIRDPTMDKRVIQFCLSLPEEQYVRRGEERRLIRSAMRGILPDKVRLNTARGVQGADWLERLLPYWRDITAEIAGIGGLETEQRYLDIPRIHHYMEVLGRPSSEMADDTKLVMLMRALIFSRFLRYTADHEREVRICKKKAGANRL